MSTKVPIYLKRGSRKGKKEKLRDILSSDMISPPLGDFRHTIHIGSGGQSDTFGDISFLQGKFHLLPRAGAEPAGPEPFEFARAATMSGAEAAAAAASPLLKNAISLPALGGAQALTLPAAQAPPKPPRLHLDEAPVSPVGRANGEAEAPVSPQHGRAKGEAQPPASHAGSLLSLHVDLGPSILDEVLQVMERHQAERGCGARHEVLT
ncbi:cdc42 effector protein 2 isoform X2 [Oenanthe melanoleuca]|uniref:cdc42 effector protein 2 isoform X2 n=1 Tax=Oenanthe melanoleuca TaxID=2939378 RepID=UPI0024C0EAAA|nr:cdc42 effector protein 2 isoform X2 [Oenanthe melanoleuca]